MRETVPLESAAARANAPVPGRLAVMTGMALVASSVPLPVVPGRVLFQLRGAVAHEVAARHGLSLSSDARQLLARPGSDDRMRDVFRQAVELAAKRFLRRVGPLSVALRALELFALGHLLDHYFSDVRPGGSARVQAAEARRLRMHIDAAVVRAFMPSTTPARLALPQGAEDLRDSFTRWLDLLLIGAATLPSYLERRLEAAFDEALASS